ncbi:MAG: prepilin-type N-terminal cleavage/methylation domain-containing protein [Halieaceae bacterium]|nr:prepilin-type N-terminal cleavage/methylation domain-containing protein [Halieaceae bacterium]
MTLISRRTARGFSLLEMVVAISILGLALAALYQAASGATRNVRTDEKYAFGVELARSLLAEHSRVPRGGLSDRGETEGGFVWTVDTWPVETAREGLPQGSLHYLEITVGWTDGRKPGRFVLNSVVEALPR